MKIEAIWFRCGSSKPSSQWEARMQSSSGKYVPQLDGVRAVCIIFTVIHHMPGKPDWINGTVGVDIFFALSEWLITSMLLSEADRSGKINLAAFYIRRVARIAPMYYMTLLLYIIASIIVIKIRNYTSDWDQLKIAIPWYATFNSEYRPLSAGDIAGHSWTLGVEEKFYLIWPLIFAATRSRAVVAFALSCIASYCLVFLADFHTGPIRGYLGLGFGAALAIAVAHRPALVPVIGQAGVGAASITGIALLHTLSILTPSPAWNMGISFCAAFFVANLWHAQGGFITKALSWLPLAFAGRLTFGMYLLHVLVINVIIKIAFVKLRLDPGFWPSLAVVYSCSIVTAYVFYRTIEGPCIQLGRSIARRSLASEAT